MAVLTTAVFQRKPVDDFRFPNVRFYLRHLSQLVHDASGGAASIQLQVNETNVIPGNDVIVLTRFAVSSIGADPGRYNLAPIADDFEALQGVTNAYALVTHPTVPLTGAYVRYVLDKNGTGCDILPFVLGKIVSNYGRIYATMANTNGATSAVFVEGYVLRDYPIDTRNPLL